MFLNCARYDTSTVEYKLLKWIEKLCGFLTAFVIAGLDYRIG